MLRLRKGEGREGKNGVRTLIFTRGGGKKFFERGGSVLKRGKKKKKKRALRLQRRGEEKEKGRKLPQQYGSSPFRLAEGEKKGAGRKHAAKRGGEARCAEVEPTLLPEGEGGKKKKLGAYLS